MLAVLDGVGGWANKGVDVALYSKELMKNVNEEFKLDPNANPKVLLSRAG